MRISAILTLVIATVFLLTPSINSGLWTWFGDAPILTQMIACIISVSMFGVLLGNAIGIRATDIQQRTWRNFGFIASAISVALVMVGMVLIATLTTIPDWFLPTIFMTFAAALFAWVHALLSSPTDRAAK